MQDNKIQDLLSAQGDRELITIKPDATVFEAVARMVGSNVGSVLVVENGRICGIMSERDSCVLSRFRVARPATRRCTN